MPTREELRNLATTRLKEARVLLSHGLYDGSRYLAGYVVELALKARICTLLDVETFPDSGRISSVFKTHNFDDLVKLAGLEKKLNEVRTADKTFEDNWLLVNKWSEEARYDPVGTRRIEDAEQFIDALEEPTSGVLTWLKKRW